MKNFRIEIKWALIFSGTTLLWMLFEKSMGWHDRAIDQHLVGSAFFAIPSILIYVFAIRDKKFSFFEGKISWQQATVSGIYMSLFVALLSPVVQYVTFEWLTPNFFGNMIKHVVDAKQMSVVAAQDYFNLPSYIKQGVFGSLSMGVVTSAIVAYFVQYKKK